MEEQIKFTINDDKDESKADQSVRVELSEERTDIGVYSITTFAQPILWIWSRGSILFKEFIVGSDLKNRFEDLLKRIEDPS